MPYKDKEQAKLQRLRYYAANREKIIAQTKTYHLAHPEQRAQINARYREKHREEIRGRYHTKHREKHRKHAKQKWADNRPAMLQRSRKNYEKHREKILQAQRDARLADPEEFRRRRRAARRIRVEKFRAKERERYRKNPEHFKANAALRRARKKGATIGDTTAIAAFYRHVRSARVIQCHYCGRLVPKGQRHVDHVIPLSRHGPHCVGNLVAACRDCNLLKHTRTADEFMDLLDRPRRTAPKQASPAGRYGGRES